MPAKFPGGSSVTTLCIPISYLETVQRVSVFVDFYPRYPIIIASMALLLDTNEPAIVRGIKTVGVGKKGSKPVSAELAQEILNDLKAGKVAPAAQGAFFAGLLAKGVAPEEEILVKEVPTEKIFADAPEFIRWICIQLIEGKTFDKQTAYDLGKFLLSNEAGDGARGFIASYLRVRYETHDEYESIWKAMQETIVPAFRGATPSGEPIIQMAEPFDGNDHSYMVTPLIARFIQAQGYRVVHMVGRNSGPKLVYNLLDVANHLNVTFARRSDDVAGNKPQFGWFIEQNNVSPSVDHWVNIRRQIIKRPFLATLEKFIKPLDAQILITSAFHPPYGEKMTTIAERAGFKGVLVIRNGIEGSIAFPLKRPAKILLSAQQKDGSYLRHEMDFDVEAFLKTTPAIEETREQLTAGENARLVSTYAQQGASGDQWFDLRVKATTAGIEQGLHWLKENVYGLG